MEAGTLLYSPCSALHVCHADGVPYRLSDLGFRYFRFGLGGKLNEGDRPLVGVSNCEAVSFYRLHRRPYIEGHLRLLPNEQVTGLLALVPEPSHDVRGANCKGGYEKWQCCGGWQSSADSFT